MRHTSTHPFFQAERRQRFTPREFRTKLLDLTARIRAELMFNRGSAEQQRLLKECVALFDLLEEPLERFVMHSDGGMRGNAGRD